MQHPLGMNHTLKAKQHVVIPDELAARGREGAGIGAHLALEGESEVVRVAKVEVAGQVDILKHFQVPARRTIRCTIYVCKTSSLVRLPGDISLYRLTLTRQGGRVLLLLG